MTKGQQRSFVLNFFGVTRPMSRKRRRHWIRQQRARTSWKDLAPITTVAPSHLIQERNLDPTYEAYMEKLFASNQNFRQFGDVCPECGGTGAIDSGGVTPWGSPINLPCPGCQKP